MNIITHKSYSRGHANHGWLDTYHTFSFANFYDPNKINFGALRVLNDDRVAPGMGFGTHPHKNMEIVSILLEGDLEHKDNMGNTQIIKKGDVQVISAGTGIYHSEYNKNKDREVKFLQIWIIPNKQNVVPRYDQININNIPEKEHLKQIVSPNKDDDGIWIYQNAWFYLSKIDKDTSFVYNLNDANNGVYLFLLNGKIEIDNTTLETRDGAGITETEYFNIKSLEKSEILFMEVPMIIL